MLNAGDTKKSASKSEQKLAPSCGLNILAYLDKTHGKDETFEEYLQTYTVKRSNGKNILREALTITYPRKILKYFVVGVADPVTLLEALIYNALLDSNPILVKQAL